MKKFLALLLALIMVLGLAACGNDTSNQPANPPASDNSQPADNTGDDQPAEPATPASGDKVAMVTDYGDITDQSFNQTTYEACKEYCEANGLQFTYYKPLDNSTADRVAMIEAAIADGFTIIVLPGYAFGEAIAECAPMYPDTKFVALDVSAGDLGDLADNLPNNVYSAVYQEELCGYMAGYAAVKLGYKKLGYLGGMGVPSVLRFGYGYLQGVDAAAVELGIADQVSVDYVYGNQFYGDPDITAYMDTWYGNGMEVVFACGGGIFTSAAEAAAKTGGKVIGVDVDQAAIIDAYGAGMTVTSAMKGLAATVKDTLADVIENGNWAAYGGKIETLGLVSGTDPEANYVQIPMGSTQWSDSFTQDDYKALVADMYNGTITVSNDITVNPDEVVGNVTVNVQGNIK